MIESRCCLGRGPGCQRSPNSPNSLPHHFPSPLSSPSSTGQLLGADGRPVGRLLPAARRPAGRGAGRLRPGAALGAACRLPHGCLGWAGGECSPLRVCLLAQLPRPSPAPLSPRQAFKRSTTKFWVRTSDVSTVKRIIIENMPVFVFNKVGSALVRGALRGLFVWTEPCRALLKFRPPPDACQPLLLAPRTGELQRRRAARQLGLL